MDLPSSTRDLRDRRRFTPAIGLSFENFGVIASELI